MAVQKFHSPGEEHMDPEILCCFASSESDVERQPSQKDHLQDTNILDGEIQ